MGHAPGSAGIGTGGSIKDYVTLETDGSIDYILFKHIKNGDTVEQKRVFVYDSQSPEAATKFQFLSVYYNGSSWVLSTTEDAVGQTKRSTSMSFASAGGTIKTWSYYTQINDVFCAVDKGTTVLALRALVE